MFILRGRIELLPPYLFVSQYTKSMVFSFFFPSVLSAEQSVAAENSLETVFPSC